MITQLLGRLNAVTIFVTQPNVLSSWSLFKAGRITSHPIVHQAVHQPGQLTCLSFVFINTDVQALIISAAPSFSAHCFGAGKANIKPYFQNIHLHKQITGVRTSLCSVLQILSLYYFIKGTKHTLAVAATFIEMLGCSQDFTIPK